MTFLKVTSYRRTPIFATSVLAAALLIISPSVFADEATEVSRLIKSGQLDQAMARADVFLSTKPKDAQMRFLKGLILTEKNKPTDAIGVFTKLTEDFPELPEPYNNLAVLYAGQGQFDKARTSLEMAIRTHPSYATAHENLGDVYAKLASQSYDKALQIDGGNATAQTKLSMIRDLIGNRARPGATVVAAQTAPAPVPAPTQAAASAPANTNIPAVAPTPVIASVPVAVATAPAVAPNAPAISVATKNKPREAAVADVKGTDEEIIKTVTDWARAWSSQDVEGYLAFYDKDFETPGGQNRKLWENERRKRIEGKGRIEVRVDSFTVSFENGKAVARFKQSYTSDKLSNVTNKTLVLGKTGNKWQILEEKANS